MAPYKPVFFRGNPFANFICSCICAVAGAGASSCRGAQGERSRALSSDGAGVKAFRWAVLLATRLDAQPPQRPYETAGAMELAVVFMLGLLLLLAVMALRRTKAAERAEKAARASRQLLQSVADNSPAVIYVKDLDGRYLLVNRRYEEFFHRRAAEVMGRTDYDLLPKETADSFRAVDQKALAAGITVEAEEVVPLDDGPRSYFSTRYPLQNEAREFYAVCGMSTDLTERRRAEEALRESRQRTLAIIDTALDGIITMDHQGRITEFNAAAERIFGYRAEEVIGRQLADAIIPPHLRESHNRGLAHYFATGEGPVLGKVIETAGMRADGTEMPVELSVARMPGAGEPTFTAFVRDITRRQRGEAARVLLAGIVESSDDAIISKNLNGIVTSWNRGAEKIFGYSAGEMIGQHIGRVIPPELSGEEAKILRRVGAGESISHYETTRVDKHGNRITMSLTVSPLKDAAGRITGVSKIARDITGRKRTELGLQAQLGRLNLLDQITRAIGERQDLHSVFQVVLGTLEDSLSIDFGCVCLYDPVAEKLTVACVGGRSQPLAAQLAMSEHTQMIIEWNGFARCVGGQLIYEPDVSRLEFPFSQRLSNAGLQSMVVAPLLSESNVFGILVAARRQAGAFSSGDCEFLRQLSGHVALGAHQAQLYTDLQTAYDDLRRNQQTVMEQERLRVLGQMASGIAHDINNALSPVALYTESLLEREPDLSQRTRQYLETTQRAIDDVAHTVGRMREFYRQREPQLILMPMDLNDLVKQVVDLTRAGWSDMPQERGIVIEMRTELEPFLPVVTGVESEFREALTNLVFNAVDAMPEGGTLTLRTRSTKEAAPVSAFAAMPVSRVWVEVEDTGVGMDEETRRRCLEPFFTTKGERGTGLGLAMVYGVAQRQNAELEVQSAVGRGTIVGLNFPAVPAGLQASQIARTREGRACLDIFIVDDDPLIVKTLRAILESDGHKVTSAAGGQEAIDVLQAKAGRGERFAIVITDLGMPYVDGRKVARASKMADRETPVILLTGWGQRLTAEEDVPANVDRVLNKPPKLYQLRAALAELAPSPQNDSL